MWLDNHHVGPICHGIDSSRTEARRDCTSWLATRGRPTRTYVFTQCIPSLATGVYAREVWPDLHRTCSGCRLQTIEVRMRCLLFSLHRSSSLRNLGRTLTYPSVLIWQGAPFRDLPWPASAFLRTNDSKALVSVFPRLPFSIVRLSWCQASCSVKIQLSRET